MIDIIRNVNLNTSLSATSTNNSALSIARLKANAETRCQKIKLEAAPAYYSGYYSPIGVYTYIGYQALSKILNNPLKVTSTSTKAPDEYLARDLNNYKQHIISSTFYNICYMSIAPSNLQRACVKRIRSEIGSYNKEFDARIMSFTSEHILGMTVDKDRQNVLILVNGKTNFPVINQIMSLVFIYRSIKVQQENDENNHEHQLFKQLSEYFAHEKHLEAQERANDFQQLKNIFYEYIKDLDEYIIDKTNEFQQLLTRIKNKEFENYKFAAEQAERSLESALNALAAAQKNYDTANQIYINAMAQDITSIEMQFKEAVELLNRIKFVKDYGFSDTQLWFKINQPLYVNNKDEWKRISQNVVADDFLRELLNDTLIEEKYLLYSECTVAIDFSSNTVRRYDMGGVHPQENAIPQPHISNYGCFGQHSSIIGRLITESNFIGIIEQVMEAASGLNWADGTVVRSMIQGFNTRYAEIKCFETLDTHERFSFDDFIDKKIEEE